MTLSRSILMSLAMAAVTLSQPVFDGVWVRDAKLSDPVGGRVGGDGRPVQAVTLVVELRDGVLQVTRKVSIGGQQAPPLVQRFPLDGKEVVNPAPAPGGTRGEVRSKALRQGDRVVIEGLQRIPAPIGGIDVKSNDVYEISKDGMLTVTTTRTNPTGTQTTRQVYRKDAVAGGAERVQ